MRLEDLRINNTLATSVVHELLLLQLLVQLLAILVQVDRPQVRSHTLGSRAYSTRLRLTLQRITANQRAALEYELLLGLRAVVRAVLVISWCGEKSAN